MLTERPSVGPLRARCLQFIGADPNITEIRGALCEPSLERDCYLAMHSELLRSLEGIDWVCWTGIDARHGACEALRAAGVPWSDGIACYTLDLPATWEELRASRPSNLKESLRKCYRSLQRDGLDHRLEVVTREAEVAPALADFFRLHAARAAMDGSVRRNDVFRDAASRAFLVDLCGRFAERDALRVLRLHVGGVLAATRVAFVLGGSMYLYYSGFDPAYAKYAVATTLVAESIQRAIGERLRSVNLSSGSDQSKLRWRPTEIAFREALLLSPTALGQAKYGMIHAAGRAMTESSVGRRAQHLLKRRAARAVPQ
jgi:CelD/BcsL family acetyltransferase involved in cellulose biosynthesis